MKKRMEEKNLFFGKRTAWSSGVVLVLALSLALSGFSFRLCAADICGLSGQRAAAGDTDFKQENSVEETEGRTPHFCSGGYSYRANHLGEFCNYRTDPVGYTQYTQYSPGWKKMRTYSLRRLPGQKGGIYYQQKLALATEEELYCVLRYKKKGKKSVERYELWSIPYREKAGEKRLSVKDGRKILSRKEYFWVDFISEDVVVYSEYKKTFGSRWSMNNRYQYMEFDRRTGREIDVDRESSAQYQLLSDKKFCYENLTGEYVFLKKGFRKGMSDLYLHKIGSGVVTRLRRQCYKDDPSSRELSSSFRGVLGETECYCTNLATNSAVSADITAYDYESGRERCLLSEEAVTSWLRKEEILHKRETWKMKAMVLHDKRLYLYLKIFVPGHKKSGRSLFVSVDVRDSSLRREERLTRVIHSKKYEYTPSEYYQGQFLLVSKSYAYYEVYSLDTGKRKRCHYLSREWMRWDSDRGNDDDWWH